MKTITKNDPGPWIVSKSDCVCRDYDCRNHVDPERSLRVRVEGRKLLVDCGLCGKSDSVVIYRRKESRSCTRCKLNHIVIVSYWDDRKNADEKPSGRASFEEHCPVCRAELKAFHYALEFKKWDGRAKRLREKRTRSIAGGGGAAPRTVSALDKILEGEKGAPT